MIRFPDPRSLPPRTQIAALGDDLSVETLAAAYARGIFPWPLGRGPIQWHCPNPRGVLDFADFKPPRSLRQTRRKKPWKITFNRAFKSVITACARTPRAGEAGTWISPAMIEAYGAFHAAGYAHSVEVWLGDELAGGLYGVCAAGVFSGESMFHAAADASKIAVWEIADELARQGFAWMDIQMVTPVMEALGARYIPRREFLDRLAASVGRGPLRLPRDR